jgi:signal recognition particle-docking protein FtsY
LADTDALFEALRAELVEQLRPIARPLVIDPARRPFVILVVGVNGAGKTTTIGKLGQRLKAEGKSVLLAAGDTFRAAAVEQLTSWGHRHDIPVIAQQQGSDSASVVFDAVRSGQARDADVVIADTAGRLQAKTNLMEELAKIKRVVSKLDSGAPHSVLLVLDGSVGQNALSQVKEFDTAVGLTGLIVTKLDGTAKAGVLFAIANTSRFPVHFVGIGEAVEDLRPFETRGVRRCAARARRGLTRMAQIEFRDVTKRFDNGTEALRSVSVSFEEGSMTFLTGHSGAGKSTFLRLLLRLDLPTRGQIFVNGVNIAQLPDRHIPALPAEHRCGVSGSSPASASHCLRQRRVAVARGWHARARRGASCARGAVARGTVGEGADAATASVDRRAATGRHRARSREQTAVAAGGRTDRQSGP